MTRTPLSQLNDWQLENSNQDIRGWKVQDAAGKTIGTVDELIVNTETEYVDAIRLENGSEIPTDNIELGNGVARLRGAGMDHRAAAKGALRPDRDTTVPIVEEQLEVGKRAVRTGGIRVTTHVHEKPVSEKVKLREETVDVHREPANRPATRENMAKLGDRSFDVPTTKEEPVVRKQARVVEEVHIDKDVRERDQTVKDTVRRTDVDVDRSGDREKGR